MTNITLTILFFLSLFSSPSSEFPDDFNSSETTVIMESNLVITEIMYNPSGSDGGWEWIEVYNKGNETIDLSGYVLDDASGAALSTANILNGVLEPQESIVLFDADDSTEEQFLASWGEDVNVIPVSNWPTLGNGSGDTISIWNSFESYDGDNQDQVNTVEQVTYENGDDLWPSDDGKSSIFLIALDFDNTLGGNWSLSGVSPGDQESPLFASYTSTRGDVGSPGGTDSEDTTPPTIECPETQETNSDEGQCSSVVSLLVPTATDNVSTEFTFTAIRSDGLDLEEPFPVGDTMISWTATDEADNTSLPCDQIVRVVEAEIPTAIAQNITVELDENGAATIAPEDLDNIETPSFDNCGIDEYIASRIEFSCADVEVPVLVEFSVVDINGNTSAASNAKVTVLDKLKPTFTCGVDIITISSNGDAVPLEDVVEPIVMDNCDAAPILTYSRSDEQELSAPFQVGTTTIAWQAVDASGNVEECLQTIVVDFVASTDNDIIAFSIPEQVGETNIDQTAKTIELLVPIGTDVSTLIPSFELSENATSVPELGDTIDFSVPILYTITAQDGSEQEWMVTVSVEEDTTPPTFEVKGNTEDFITELEVGDSYIVGEIMNIIDKSETFSEISGDDFVDTTVSGGPFLVTYSVSDGNNVTTLTETVLVKESTPRKLSVISFMLVNADTNEDLFLLEDNMEINITSLPTLNLNIRANTTEDVQSVVLQLSGSDSAMSTENVAPFALYGDFPVANYFGRIFDYGYYTIEATAHSEENSGGEMGEAQVLNFALLDLCGGFELNITEIQNPTMCSGIDGSVQVDYSGVVGPVVYSWSHDETVMENIATELPEGSYTVMATDSNGCTAELSFELNDPELPEVVLASFEFVYSDEKPILLTGGLPEGGVYNGLSIVDNTFDPSIGEGVYQVTYTFIDEITGCENSAEQTIEVLLPILKVQSFTLVNADTNEDIIDLTEGIEIDINSLPTLNLNIRANTTDDVESASLMLEGAIQHTATENIAPYALYGDFPVENYFGNEFTIGSYAITAMPYSDEQLQGELGTSLMVSFEFYDSELNGKVANSLNLYPNPSSTTTALSLDKKGDLKVIYVYDVMGKLIRSYTGDMIERNGFYQLDTSSIPAGTYFVKSFDEKGNAYQKQMLIKK